MDGNKVLETFTISSGTDKKNRPIGEFKVIYKAKNRGGFGISFSMMGLDKHYAIKDMRRIPKRHLFLIGYIGGAIGLLLGLKKFRHKTLKRKFYGAEVFYS
jgi:hypothetical protein